tara:strand:+ start:2108 stop:2572 length:465 start_codon:yes stop_codon:yes gene_type:complete
MNNKIQVMDIEIYPNFFCIVFYDIKSKEFTIFEISDRLDKGEQLLSYLKQNGLMLVGFNNVNFDYPLLHNTLLSNPKKWTSLELFKAGQSIIESKYSSIWDNQVKIPQLDLYKIWHYDNKNKATSLILAKYKPIKLTGNSLELYTLSITVMIIV